MSTPAITLEVLPAAYGDLTIRHGGMAQPITSAQPAASPLGPSLSYLPICAGFTAFAVFAALNECVLVPEAIESAWLETRLPASGRFASRRDPCARSVRRERSAAL